jgi:hypothetical protein
MGELVKARFPGSIQPNSTPLFGTITIGAAGAISAQSGNRNSGVTFTKNATAGRYDGVIHRGYKRCLGAEANIVGVTAGALAAATDGNAAYVNGISAANFAGTSPISTFTIQCQLPTGVATATNPASGDTIAWTLWVSDSP